MEMYLGHTLDNHHRILIVLLNSFSKHLDREVMQLIDRFHHPTNRSFGMLDWIEDYFQQYPWKKRSLWNDTKSLSHTVEYLVMMDYYWMVEDSVH